MEITKRDWALFRAKLPTWQENYMEQLNRMYLEILNGEGSPSEKFWALEARMKRDKYHPGVCVELRRQNMLTTLVTLMRDHIISEEDLCDFSDEVKQVVALFLRR